MKLLYLLILGIIMCSPLQFLGAENNQVKIVDVNKDIQVYTILNKGKKYLSNFTVIKNGKEALIIDVGYENNARLVLKDLKAKGLKPVKVVLSHTHEDHVGGYAVFKNVVFYAGELYKKDINNTDEKMSKFKPDHILKEGDTIKFGSHNISIINTPGHSASGITCIINKKILHVGDLVFFTNDDRLSVPYVGGKIKDYLADLNRIKKLKPEIILAGHGKPIIIKKDSYDNINKIIYYLTKLKEGDKNVKLSNCIKGNISDLSFHELHKINVKHHKKK